MTPHNPDEEETKIDPLARAPVFQPESLKRPKMIAYLALVVAVLGILLYFIPANPKVQEIGRILFFCGVFVFTSALGARAVRLF